MKHDGFSVIIPVYQEAQNIPELIARISKLNFNQPFEVILVDDNSQDGTIEVVEKIAHNLSWLKLFIRDKKKCLSASVVDGIKVSKYLTLIVMDGDLSHPPEKIPELLKKLLTESNDLVFGSRYIAGGRIDETWSFWRKIISKFSAIFVRCLLCYKIKDPLSGFFAVKKPKINMDKLEGIGWKIGLEIMIKSCMLNVSEVPIYFRERFRGSSKLKIRNIIANFCLINKLFFYKLFHPAVLH